MGKSRKEQTSENKRPTVFTQSYFHGTKADLQVGDLIEVGFNPNYGDQEKARHIFLTATMDAAIWGAELAAGNGHERIYVVEPTGEIEDDPDLTDKKFPGNPTKSYRSKQAFRIIGEVIGWQGHPSEQVGSMKENLAMLKIQGIHSQNK